MHSMPGCKKPCKAKFLECNRVHSTRAFIRNRCQHRCASRPNDQKRHASRRTAFGPTLSSNESIDDLSTGPDESDGTSSSNRYSTREGLDSPTMGPFSDSRRHAILSALGHIAGAHMISRKEAVAFPSPNLETLQESAATSSRCGGDVGISALRNPAIYRGAATDKAVRTVYSLDGLLPVRRLGLQEEVDRASYWIQRCVRRLEKYQALMTLKETNRDCFFGLLLQNVDSLLPIVYTPTVGEACQEWSHLLHRPTGMYVSMSDQGNIRHLVQNWPEDEVKIVVITDGERILGLGDLGANGLGIPVGKGIVHSLGGIHPRFIIPIVVDVGCNVPSVRDDPLYIGLQQERQTGSGYDELFEELLGALRERFGQSLLVHWEDFASRNSYRLLARAREKGISTFNDDIESTAAAVLAAIFGATQIEDVPGFEQQTFLLLGAGQANIGSARLLTKALQAEGLSEQEAKQRIWMFDSKGLVHEGVRQLSKEKAEFARSNAEGERFDIIGFTEGVRRIKPTALIGAAAKRGTFSREVIEALFKVTTEQQGRNARPIVLALSNPDSVAECTAQEAYDWSGGAAVFGSGTTFPSFKTRNGETYEPSQANNSLIFPDALTGVGLGCIASGATAVTDDMMLAAARAVARKVTPEERQRTSILPATNRLREVALSVAAAVALTAVENMVASSSSSDLLSCLPLGKSADDPEALQQAEACIARQQYDPFATEVTF